MLKAFIEDLDNHTRIEVMFNPKEYTITKTASWSREAAPGSNTPSLTFTSGEPQTLTVQLFFDTYLEKTDVRRHTKKLAKLMEVSIEDEGPTHRLRPPKVKFHWGLTWSFKAVITSMTQHFTLFLPTGTPVRATVDVTFQQIADERSFPGQNPTSGGAAGRRTHIVEAGETLDWIAYLELGSPRHWRSIAETNGVSDPLRIPAGTVLAIDPEV